MTSSVQSALRAAAFVACWVFPAEVTAQDTSPPAHVVSIDPYGLANQRLTAEAEFCGGGELSGTPLGCGLTTGVTATFERHPRPDGSTASKHHVDTEAFVRIRTGGLTGSWFGVRTGLTFAERHGFRPSLGVDAGVSRTFARRFYAAASVGAKKVLLLDGSSDLDYNPSFRLATGIAF